MRLTVLAPAKLNLFLDITGKRNDGYHIVNMIMQSVSLFDEVTVTTEDGEDITVSCTDKNIPCDSTNTAYIAAQKFFEYAEIAPTGLSIKIRKRIPSQAGMAGGSTDAAAVLIAMNEMFETDYSQSELAEIAAEVGADVPFCLFGGTMTATGIGTILSPLPDIPDCFIVIVKPEINISTKAAYQKSDETGYDECKNSDAIADCICTGSLEGIGKNLYNKFEEVVDISEIKGIKNCMKHFGALGACLTGSGSAVFGIFTEKSDADDCICQLETVYNDIYLVHPTSEGCHFAPPQTLLSSLF
ncbi:MAG: 4-(cytidine 5'-diphospho)-2-C-methyl-D-erythritol kinase [Acutalibacteraceae bacterium]